jgi:hypothetical protein
LRDYREHFNMILLNTREEHNRKENGVNCM